jgi:hypothetical protein
MCHRAYIAARENFLESNVSKKLTLTHAELTMLFITALELIVTSIYVGLPGRAHDPNLFLRMLPWGCALLMLSLAGDAIQLRNEIDELTYRGESELVNFLRKRGFIPSSVACDERGSAQLFPAASAARVARNAISIC